MLQSLVSIVLLHISALKVVAKSSDEEKWKGYSKVIGLFKGRFIQPVIRVQVSDGGPGAITRWSYYLT